MFAHTRLWLNSVILCTVIIGSPIRAQLPESEPVLKPLLISRWKNTCLKVKAFLKQKHDLKTLAKVAGESMTLFILTSLLSRTILNLIPAKFLPQYLTGKHRSMGFCNAVSIFTVFAGTPIVHNKLFPTEPVSWTYDIGIAEFCDFVAAVTIFSNRIHGHYHTDTPVIKKIQKGKFENS